MALLMIARGLVVAGLLWAGAAAAQPTLVPPKEVVILVHRDLRDTEFVEPLVCELSHTLVMPVRAQPIDLPLDAGLMASPTQLDAYKVAARLHQAIGSGPDAFAFLIVPHDLTTARFRYVFGASFSRPFNNGVVSTTRLAPSDSDVGAAQATQLTMLRTYKIILRYVAQLAGLWEQEGCVLAMPRSVEELDRKPAEFCEADRALLVEAGIVKVHPGGACGRVAAAG